MLITINLEYQYNSLVDQIWEIYTYSPGLFFFLNFITVICNLNVLMHLQCDTYIQWNITQPLKGTE